MDSSRNIQDYFQYGASLIKQAGQCKRNQELEQAYIFLKSFEILVSQVLPKHPQIEHHRSEYNYNVEVGFLCRICFSNTLEIEPIED